MKKVMLLAVVLSMLAPGIALAEIIDGNPDFSVVDGILRVRTGDSLGVFRIQNNGMRFHRDGTIFFDVMNAGSRIQFRTSTTTGARDVTPMILQNDGTVTMPGGNLELTNVAARIGIGTANPATALDVRGTGTVEVLEITGGADLSETFNVLSSGAVSPGMVVSIDPKREGELRVSGEAYDRTVAGIISGAGNLKTGMVMGQQGSIADGEYPVALTGRVYCYVDASFGAIQSGDLLTTSPTPGHAMKVTDFTQAQGAILGKAMTPLKEGKGLILVLVSLQ